jgi:hypothetical protein
MELRDLLRSGSRTVMGPPPPPPFVLAQLPQSTSPAISGSVSSVSGSTADTSTSSRSPGRTSNSDNYILQQLLHGQRKLFTEMKDLNARMKTIEEQLQSKHLAIESGYEWNQQD